MRLLTAILVFSALTGCATHPPASCDGSQRRPVNSIAHAGLHFPSCGAGVA